MIKNFFLLLLLLFASCQETGPPGIHLPKETIKKIYPAIVEVIVPKQEDDNIVYADKLPFEKQDFHIRNDKYHPLGTAFFISSKRLASAAHVFGIDKFTLWKDYFIRDSRGEVYQVGKIVKYSQYRDYIEFELENYPKSFNHLSLARRIEIGDMVYAVGNAQGEGIATRGGQVSSFTPEHVEGLWNFIRFSSPTSPGNSGGPLVNSKGLVVGIVVMKNNAENLNFALPVDELKNISTERAEFFRQGLKIEDGIQMVENDWKVSFPLPGDLKTLREKSIASKSIFYRELLEKFKVKYAGVSFPTHHRFRDYLRSQKLPLYGGQVNKDINLNKWTVDANKFKKMMIGEQQIFHYSRGGIFSYWVFIENVKKRPMDQQILDEKKLVETIIKGLGATRKMAGHKIPIVSYGKSHETIKWRDRMGRPWFSYFWNIKYNNTFMAIHATPTPQGIHCHVDVNLAEERNEGYVDLLKENILELPLSYPGKIEEWRDFLALADDYLPTIFQKKNVIATGKNGIVLRTSEYSFNIPRSLMGTDAVIVARVGFDPGKVLAAKVLAWEIKEKKGHKNGLIISQYLKPEDFALDHLRVKWEKITKKDGRFNGKVQEVNGIYSVGKVLNPVKTDFWLKGKVSKLPSFFVIDCFSEMSKGKAWPLKLCANIKKNFRLQRKK